MSEHTFQAILARMKERIETEADRREGTWTGDNLQAVANELARIYSEDIDAILPQAFVVTASGKNLDAACSDYGIKRREAACAEVLVELAGAPGMYYDISVYAEDLEFCVQGAVLLKEGEAAAVWAICTQAGEIGNVAAGSMDRTSDERIRIAGSQDAQGGYDEEDDETLRERTLEHIRTPANSGNIAHYIQWAKEVPGVEKVMVYDLARGAGTVDVVITASGNQPAPPVLVRKVAEHIEALRLVGPDVLVAGAEAVPIGIEAEVLMQPGYTAEALTQELQAGLQELCSQTTFRSRTVSYLGIANLIFRCAGVVDVQGYRINGAAESVRLQERQFPVPGQLSVTVQEEKDA